MPVTVLEGTVEGTVVVMVATDGGDEGRGGACTADAGFTITRLNLLLTPLNRSSHGTWFQNWLENKKTRREWSSPSLTQFHFSSGRNVKSKLWQRRTFHERWGPRGPAVPPELDPAVP